MRNLLAWFAKTTCRVILWLPLKWRWALGDLLGFIWFEVLRLRRQVVDENIQKVFPEWSHERRRALARVSINNMGRTVVEYAELAFLNKQRAQALTRIHGEHHLQEALKKGRGVLLLTLHMGNGDLCACCLAQLGYPMGIITKEFKLKWLHEMWFGLRQKLGVELIPPRHSGYMILKALKRNVILGFVLDQFTGPPIGVKTTFFGIETGTALGLALMAERSGAAVVPTYCLRDEEGHAVVHFEKPQWVEVGENRDKDLQAATQEFNHILERFVRNHPEQWMWVHKRWKRHIVR